MQPPILALLHRRDPIEIRFLIVFLFLVGFSIFIVLFKFVHLFLDHLTQRGPSLMSDRLLSLCPARTPIRHSPPASHLPSIC